MSEFLFIPGNIWNSCTNFDCTQAACTIFLKKQFSIHENKNKTNEIVNTNRSKATETTVKHNQIISLAESAEISQGFSSPRLPFHLIIKPRKVFAKTLLITICYNYFYSDITCYLVPSMSLIIRNSTTDFQNK